MFSMKPMLLSLALCFGMASFSAPAATAQSTKVVVIDSAKIIRDSKAGADIRTKLQNISEGMKNELKPTAEQLTAELKTLNAQLEGQTREAILTNAALKSQVESYSRKENDFNRRSQIMAQELNLTRQKAWNDFRVALNPVLQAVVNERSADLMLDRSNAVYAGDAIDVTASVVSKLDAATPTISVVRQKLPTQPQ